MKINRLLSAALITLATVLTGCVKESVWDVKTGIDESKAAPEEFNYDEELSSKNTLAVYWDGQKAKAAGAKSFFVQLTDMANMDKGNSWDSKLTKVLEITEDTEYSAQFSGLTEYSCYYVRVRANYPGSVYSPWVYLTKEDGTPALMQIGHGQVALVPVVSATALVKEIEVVWTLTEGATKYLVEWKETAGSSWQSAETTDTKYTINGLTPETSYDIKVTSVTATDKHASDVISVSTKEQPPFPMTIETAQQWVDFVNGEIIPLAAATDVVTLGADLDFAGIKYETAAEFKGILDGNGKTIKNLAISTPFLKKVNEVKDLTFDASCALTSTTDGKFAMLAEVSTGLVSNVTNNGNVTVDLTEAPASDDALIAAGIVAEADADIVNCHNNGNVTINSAEGLEASLAAGICGYAATKVTDCTNSGKVSQNSTHYIVSAWVTYKGIAKVPQHTGGIVAMSKDESIIENCINNGNVVLNMTAIEKIGKSAGTNRIRIGGIAGAPRGDIKGCTNKGTVECYARTSDRSAMTAASGSKNYSVSPGGITGGQMDWGGKTDSGIDTGMDVINCVNEGDVIVDADVDGNNSTVGGIVSHPGWESINNTNTIENCVNKGNITVRGGGLFRIGGINGGIANIVGCENYGTMTLATNTKAGSSIAGISGFMNNGSKFENNKNYGDIVESSDVAHTVAGLIGGVGNTESVTYGAGCVVNCSVTTAKSTTQAGMVFGAGAAKTTVEPTFGTSESPIKVAGTFNGTPVDASNVASTAKGSSSKGIMNVVFGE